MASSVGVNAGHKMFQAVTKHSSLDRSDHFARVVKTKFFQQSGKNVQLDGQGARLPVVPLLNFLEAVGVRNINSFSAKEELFPFFIQILQIINFGRVPFKVKLFNC